MNTSARFNCSGCAAGEFSAADWSLVCNDCEAGTYSSSAASSCSACTGGTYSTTSKATTCTECSDGTFTDGAGGHTVCQSCGPGTFSNSDVGHDGCELCAEGHSTNLTGQSTCQNCPSGRYTPIRGSIECLHCAKGHYSVVNSTDCVKCTNGKYAADLDSAQCKDPTLGHFLVGCESGTFDGCIRSVPCQAGRYASELLITSCPACSAGRFSLEGSSSCTACPEGKYSTDFPSTASCKSAAIGYYVPGPSATEQLPCQIGHGTNVKGMVSCPECPPGSVSWRQGSRCLECEPGTFQEEGGKSECHPCERGTFSVAGATACTVCTNSSTTDISLRRQCMLHRKPDAPKSPPSDTTLAFEVIGIGIVGSVLIGAIIVSMVGGLLWYRSHMSASGKAIKDTINTTADGVLHQEGEWSELRNEAGKLWYYNARTDEVTYTKPY